MTTNWADSTFSIEDLKRICDEMQPIIEANRKTREEYYQMVLVYVSKLRPCPLIQQMYGSMIAAFDVSPPPLKFPPLELKIEPPKKNWQWFTPMLGVLKGDLK